MDQKWNKQYNKSAATVAVYCHGFSRDATGKPPFALKPRQFLGKSLLNSTLLTLKLKAKSTTIAQDRGRC